MTDRFVTVPDSLELPAAVKVPVARLVGPTGAAATPADIGAATAAQGALADTAVQPDNLGNAAGLDVGTAAGTVMAGDDSRVTSLSSTYGALGTRPAARVAPPTRPTWITTFQAGHGWTDTLASGTLADDTDAGDFIMGTQSVRIINSTCSKAGLALDMSDKHLVVRLRVNSFVTGHTVAVYAHSGAWTDFWLWEVAGLADQAKRWFQAGEWAYVTLPFDTATVTGSPNRAALDLIRIRPATQGDINVQAIGHAAEGTQAARVSFTFDDGYTDWLTLAAPTLAKYGIAGTGYVIPSFDGTVGYLTAAQCRTLQDTYGWDLEMHGDSDLSTLTAAQMRTEWTTSKKWFADNGLGRAEHVAYPYGQTDAEVVATAREFYGSGRTIANASPLESWPPAMPHRLRAVSGVSSAAGGNSKVTVKAHIDKAVASGQWLILVFHHIGATAPDTMWCTTADLDEIAAYAVASGAQVSTIADALA